MDNSIIALYNQNKFQEVVNLVEPNSVNSLSLDDFFIVLDATLEISDLKKAKELINRIQTGDLSHEQHIILTYYSCKLLLYEGFFQQGIKEISELINEIDSIDDSSLCFRMQCLYAIFLYHNGETKLFKEILDQLRQKFASNDEFLIQITILQGYYDLLTGNLEASIQILEKILDKDLLLNRPFLKARICFLLSALNLKLGEIQNAIKFGLECEKVAQENNFKLILSEAYGILTSSYREYGDYNKAKNYVLSGIRINKNIGNQFELARHYGNLANIYAFEGKYSQAIENYLNSLEYFNNLNYGKYISFIFNNLGNIYRIQGNLQEAKKYYHDSLKMMLPFNDQQAIVSRYTNLGDIYYELQELEESYNFYIKAFEFHLKSHNKYQILSVLYKLLVVQRELGIPVNSNQLLKHLTHYEIDLPNLEAKYLQIQSLINQDKENYSEAVSLLQQALEKPGVQFEEKMINYENIILNKLLQLQKDKDLSLEALQKSGILSILSAMEKLAQERQMYPDLCKIYLLMSKISFLTGDNQNKQKYSNIALEIANSKELNLYYNLIKMDIDKISESNKQLNFDSKKEMIMQISDYIQFIGKKLNDMN